MDTLLIQPTSEKAYRLIKELEDLHLIKVIKRDNKLKPLQKLSEKYAGKLPADIADDLQRHVTQSRNEWDRGF